MDGAQDAIRSDEGQHADGDAHGEHRIGDLTAVGQAPRVPEYSAVDTFRAGPYRRATCPANPTSTSS